MIFPDNRRPLVGLAGSVAWTYRVNEKAAFPDLAPPHAARTPTGRQRAISRDGRFAGFRT